MRDGQDIHSRLWKERGMVKKEKGGGEELSVK